MLVVIIVEMHRQLGPALNVRRHHPVTAGRHVKGDAWSNAALAPERLRPHVRTPFRV